MMWNILTYAYNTLLVIFIATHLLISFLVGLYLGIYLAQNYAVPRITEPSLLYEKVVRFLEQHRLRSIRPARIMTLIREDSPTGKSDDVVQGLLQVNARSDSLENEDNQGTNAAILFSTHAHLE
ncbi:uncharacterized protein LOC110855048 isoform X2 [Folsomia candida]|uniref:uncharacterized protein LOC110855048 isoform X2 n=1 Tax=Folsomia candida TaxID=158441 RepID=UPI000B8F6864|nr:uncharacterized protein LOC110855048 isoform X2 [Folsomia candida]